MKARPTQTTKRLSEFENTIQEFVAFFWNDKIIIDNHSIPLGLVSAEILNMPDKAIAEMFCHATEFAETFKIKVMDSQGNVTLETMNEIQTMFNVLFKMIRDVPPFNRLALDEKLYEQFFIRVYKESPVEFRNSIKSGSIENQIMNDFIVKLLDLPSEILNFKHYITVLLDEYYSRLKQRTPENYAIGICHFLSNAELQRMMIKYCPSPHTPLFVQDSSVMVQFTTMPNPDNSEKYIATERIIFNHITDFLHFDFFRGVMCGNAPRRCNNCDRYFLLMGGYNTVYCESIAPGYKDKTCRQIGAKEAYKEKAEDAPPKKLYNQVYRKLQQRLYRGKISLEEWNDKVAEAQARKDEALCGKITISKLEKIYKNI